MEPSTRIAWLDVARGYGMFLVFYGHLAEQLSKGSFPEAFEQFKFIYSFHMPMFFVFAGLLAPTRPELRPTCRTRACCRSAFLSSQPWSVSD